MNDQIKPMNMRLLKFVENVGLLAIAVATVIAMCVEIASMAKEMRVSLADLLMLFLYMEVLAMVGHHYSTGKMPVRFPLYIGMVALARYLILDIKEMDDWRMLAVSGSILLLTLAVLLIRVGHVRYPYVDDKNKS
jgi:protein PsiE